MFAVLTGSSEERTSPSTAARRAANSWRVKSVVKARPACAEPVAGTVKRPASATARIRVRMRREYDFGGRLYNAPDAVPWTLRYNSIVAAETRDVRPYVNAQRCTHQLSCP